MPDSLKEHGEVNATIIKSAMESVEETGLAVSDDNPVTMILKRPLSEAKFSIFIQVKIFHISSTDACNSDRRVIVFADFGHIYLGGIFCSLFVRTEQTAHSKAPDFSKTLALIRFTDKSRRIIRSGIFGRIVSNISSDIVSEPTLGEHE